MCKILGVFVCGVQSSSQSRLCIVPCPAKAVGTDVSLLGHTQGSEQLQMHCYLSSNYTKIIITIITINAIVLLSCFRTRLPKAEILPICGVPPSPLHHQTLDKWGSNDFSVAPSKTRKSCAQTTEQCTLLPSVCLPLKPHFQTVAAHKYISQEEIPDANCFYSHLLTSPTHSPGLDLGLWQLWELLFIPPRWVLLMDRAGLCWFLSPVQVCP